MEGPGADGRGRGSLNLSDIDRGNIINRSVPAGDGERGTGSLRLPLAGRVSPSDLGRFLGTRGRQSDLGLTDSTRGGSLRASGLRGDALRRLRGDAVGGLRGDSVGLRGDAVGGLRGDAVGGLRGDAVGGLRGRLNGINLNAGQINNIRTNVNTAISNQVNVNRVTNIGAINNINRFDNRYFHGHPHRANYWNNWCGGIVNHCNFNRFNGCFSNHFWATNFCHFPWQRSYYWWGARPWSYWYGCPTWSSFGSWFPGFGLSSPFYYDYGVGGNVVYDGGYVYVNGSQVATAGDYAASAAELAVVPTPANPDAATEWLPLGTFTLSTGEADKDPTRVVQLAVDKEGNISGTMVNEATNQTYPVQGRVDKETQRVAFTIGGRQDVVLETGLYNLTQQQTPVLAHGDGREETYLLYRLEAKDTPATAPRIGAPLLP